MIVAIIALPVNIIFAIMALIFVCEVHELRFRRMQQPTFFCCCGSGAFKVIMWVFAVLGLISQLSVCILYFKAAGICDSDSSCPPEVSSALKGVAGFLIYAMIANISLATTFTMYINGYTGTYNIQPSIGAYS